MPLDQAPGEPASQSPQRLKSALQATRRLSGDIVAPLSFEDQVVQASGDASPAKWHLAHTTWFFEELVLKSFLPDYRVFDERLAYCFNSYYESLGSRHPRGQRGLLTRPSAEEVRQYRGHVDAALETLTQCALTPEALSLIEIGINHEQQHQELMLTDILALFDANPLKPAYCEGPSAVAASMPELAWLNCSEGVYEIGHAGPSFAYDNEGPRHKTYIRPFRIASRAVTNGEWISFMQDGGYSKPSLWLSDGWAYVQRERWNAPGYWSRADGHWGQMTLHGLRDIEAARPVTHVSYYEADAFARWAGHRLPTEFEWEVASEQAKFAARTYDLGRLLPDPAQGGELEGMGDAVWEWTQSAYSPYPGYQAIAGPLGEYNGKFMCNQYVLRGGSVATPPNHTRPTYRNFFYPHQRWQFMGLRLAANA